MIVSMHNMFNFMYGQFNNEHEKNGFHVYAI